MEQRNKHTIESYLARCVTRAVDTELLLMHFTGEDILRAEERGFIVREETEDDDGLMCSHRIDFNALRRAGHQRVFN